MAVCMCVCICICTCVNLYHILFIRSSINGHCLGCFPLLVVLNNAAVNTAVQISAGEFPRGLV